MLISKEVTPEQAKTAAPQATAEPETHAALLPESTSYTLMVELNDIVESRKSARKAMLASTVGGLLLGFAIGMICLTNLARSSLGAFLFPLILLPELLLILLGAYGSLHIGRSFYKRKRERLHVILPALAERRETRLLPCLLELMDLNLRGAWTWQESRPVFVRSLAAALTNTTQDQFQWLSPSQAAAIVRLFYFPENSLREAAVEILIRCGDSRMLADLKVYRVNCGAELSLPMRLFCRLNPIMRFLRKQGDLFGTEETRDAIDRAITGLKERIEAMKRDAQLLRPSDRDSAPAGRELVRAAISPSAANRAEELVRPIKGDGPQDPVAKSE